MKLFFSRQNHIALLALVIVLLIVLEKPLEVLRIASIRLGCLTPLVISLFLWGVIYGLFNGLQLLMH